MSKRYYYPNLMSTDEIGVSNLQPYHLIRDPYETDLSEVVVKPNNINVVCSHLPNDNWRFLDTVGRDIVKLLCNGTNDWQLTRPTSIQSLMFRLDESRTTFYLDVEADYYLFHHIKVMMKQGELQYDYVTFFYFYWTVDGSCLLQEINLDGRARMEDQPEGFFDLYRKQMMLLM